MFHHECKVKRDEDALETNTNDTTFKSRWERCWKKWCSIDQSTSECNKYMHSISAVLKERKRHLGSDYWWVIHPFSYFKYVFNRTMLF